jgi:PAS domain S-box-containing protein
VIQKLPATSKPSVSLKAGAPVVLIVDDDKGLVRLLEKTLQREGFEAPSATSGREAFHWLQKHRPDLVLLDLQLQDMEGKQLIQRLNDAGRGAPFIIITGQGDERVAVEMMKRGALDYLVKDVRLQEFVPTVVHRALDHIRKERRLAAAEEALRKEHAFITAVLNTSGALVVVLDREGRIVRFNRGCELTSGYSFDEVSGRLFWELFITPEELDGVKAAFDSLRLGHVPSRHENHWRARDGSRRLIDWTNSVLLDEHGQVEYIVATGIDITERKRLEKEILEISDREQRRIGQDLHDGICQRLAGIELMSEVLEQRLSTKAKTEAPRAAQIASHVRDSIDETRLLARGLSPVMVESEGLMAALQELASNTEKIFHVHSEFRCGNPVLMDDHSVATHLFRIAQEAVSNAIKHGKARFIEIELASDGKTTVTVRDDGVGFPDKLHNNKGMGLRIMHYRAGMIGGKLHIGRRAKGGTEVSCTIQKSARNPESGWYEL